MLHVAGKDTGAAEIHPGLLSVLLAHDLAPGSREESLQCGIASNISLNSFQGQIDPMYRGQPETCFVSACAAPSAFCVPCSWVGLKWMRNRGQQQLTTAVLCPFCAALHACVSCSSRWGCHCSQIHYN